MFKNHLEMIGRNESPSKKAKFWQSYIRSLKGSEDIRAHDSPRPNRPYSSYLDAPSTYRSIYDEPATTQERIQSSGYRYLPVHRETYGYSPRAIYDHHYSRSIPATYDAEKAWNDHLQRMKEIERRYPSRYGLYLRDKTPAATALAPLEYEPEDKLLQELKDKARRSRSPSAPIYRAGSVLPSRALSVPPVSPYDRASSLEPPSYSRYYPRASSLEPIERALARLPLYPRNRLADLLNPNPNMPISAITRDPFWWDVEDLMPVRGHTPGLTSSSPLVRDSYLSPVKNRYLWSRHPARPLFAHRYYY